MWLWQPPKVSEDGRQANARELAEIKGWVLGVLVAVAGLAASNVAHSAIEDAAFGIAIGACLVVGRRMAYAVKRRRPTSHESGHSVGAAGDVHVPQSAVAQGIDRQTL
jgi:hypothetical protein